jgi:tRNA(Ile)-lysidine synthase
MPRRTAQSRSSASDFAAQVLQSVTRLGAVGQLVLVAISGGPDSTALLVALHHLRRKKRLNIAAAHVNHALRGDESDADERFVRELCERLKIPLVCRRLAVPLRASDRAEGIESAARKLRQSFFSEAAREFGAKFVATAHTADDQAETVLHRIVRGTGLAGLAGIPTVRPLAPGIKMIRPLLNLKRSDVTRFLTAIGQASREDRSNRDLTFTRNRVRHRLIPNLIKHFNPQVVEALVRLAAQAHESQSVIDRQVRRLHRRSLIKRDAQKVVLNVARLNRAPRFLISAMILHVWREQGWPLQEMGEADLTRVADLVSGSASAWDLPGGVRAKRVQERLVLTRNSPEAQTS